MPEGHTLHRLATALDDAFAGHPVRVSSPQGRFTESAALLDGRTVETAESWGKHLWVHFAHDDLVHVHLGLYGRFDVVRDADVVPAPVGQVRLRLVQADALDGPSATASYADLRGATACELQTREQREALVARLGPDPLRPDADPDLAWHRIKRSRAPIAGLLMDQSVISGIGNVYRAELLYRHRVDPFRPGDQPAGGPLARDVGRPGGADGRWGPHRPDRHGPPRAPDRRRSAPPPSRAADTPTSTAARGSRAGSAGPGCARGTCSPATCTGARTASPDFALGVVE